MPKLTYDWLVRYRLFSKWGKMMLKDIDRNRSGGAVDFVSVMLDPKACADIVCVELSMHEIQWEVRILSKNLGEWYTLEVCGTCGEATRFCKRMRFTLKQYSPLKK